MLDLQRRNRVMEREIARLRTDAEVARRSPQLRAVSAPRQRGTPPVPPMANTGLHGGGVEALAVSVEEHEAVKKELAASQRKVQELQASMQRAVGSSDRRSTASNGASRLLFDKMDKNQDGSVDRIEMIQALRRDPEARACLGLPARFQQGSPEHAAFEGVFQRLDQDGSRHITWDEFVAIVATVDSAASADAQRTPEDQPAHEP